MDQQTRGLLGPKTAPEHLQQENTVKIEVSNSEYNGYSCSLHHCLPKIRSSCATRSLGKRHTLMTLVCEYTFTSFGGFSNNGMRDARRKCGLLHSVFQLIKQMSFTLLETE